MVHLPHADESLTVKQARQLATALIVAADEADEMATRAADLPPPVPDLIDAPY